MTRAYYLGISLGIYFNQLLLCKLSLFKMFQKEEQKVLDKIAEMKKFIKDEFHISFSKEEQGEKQIATGNEAHNVKPGEKNCNNCQGSGKEPKPAPTP